MQLSPAQVCSTQVGSAQVGLEQVRLAQVELNVWMLSTSRADRVGALLDDLDVLSIGHIYLPWRALSPLWWHRTTVRVGHRPAELPHLDSLDTGR